MTRPSDSLSVRLLRHPITDAAKCDFLRKDRNEYNMWKWGVYIKRTETRGARATLDGLQVGPARKLVGLTLDRKFRHTSDTCPPVEITLANLRIVPSMSRIPLYPVSNVVVTNSRKAGRFLGVICCFRGLWRCELPN